MIPTPASDTIWERSQAVSRRLFAWNVANIIGGLLLARRGGRWRGVASQNIGWGVINIGIAVIGARATDRRRQQMDDPHAPAVLAKETRNLRRLLWINAGLDLLYMVGGWQFARTRGKHNEVARGTGHGIILQGVFLFVFDVTQALVLPPVEDHDAAD